jgi:hypothetical protein
LEGVSPENQDAARHWFPSTLLKPSPMKKKMAGIGKIFLRRGKKG